jgi:hypothetical protein
MLDDEETDALILASMDRWTVALDDAFIDGWPLLEASALNAASQLTFAELVHATKHDEAHAALLERWSLSVIDPVLRLARVDLERLRGEGPVAPRQRTSLCRPTLPPLRAGSIFAGWVLGVVVLTVATVATTIGLTLAPVINVVSTVLGFALGLFLMVGPAAIVRRRLGASAVHALRDAVYAGPDSLRARTLALLEETAISKIASGRST